MEVINHWLSATARQLFDGDYIFRMYSSAVLIVLQLNYITLNSHSLCQNKENNTHYRFALKTRLLGCCVWLLCLRYEVFFWPGSSVVTCLWSVRLNRTVPLVYIVAGVNCTKVHIPAGADPLECSWHTHTHTHTQQEGQLCKSTCLQVQTQTHCPRHTHTHPLLREEAADEREREREIMLKIAVEIRLHNHAL